MAIFPKDNNKKGTSRKSSISSGGGSGVFPGTGSRSGVAAGGSNTIIVEDEGALLNANTHTINFNNGFDVTSFNNTVTVDATGGGGGGNSVTGGEGIAVNEVNNEDVVSVDLAPSSGLEFTSDQLDVNIKNTDHLTKDIDGLDVNTTSDDGIATKQEVADARAAQAVWREGNTHQHLAALEDTDNGVEVHVKDTELVPTITIANYNVPADNNTLDLVVDSDGADFPVTAGTTLIVETTDNDYELNTDPIPTAQSFSEGTQTLWQFPLSQVTILRGTQPSITQLNNIYNGRLKSIHVKDLVATVAKLEYVEEVISDARSRDIFWREGNVHEHLVSVDDSEDTVDLHVVDTEYTPTIDVANYNVDDNTLDFGVPGATQQSLPIPLDVDIIVNTTDNDYEVNIATYPVANFDGLGQTTTYQIPISSVVILRGDTPAVTQVNSIQNGRLKSVHNKSIVATLPKTDYYTGGDGIEITDGDIAVYLDETSVHSGLGFVNGGLSVDIATNDSGLKRVGTGGNTGGLAVDTDFIADTEWVKELVDDQGNLEVIGEFANDTDTDITVRGSIRVDTDGHIAFAENLENILVSSGDAVTDDITGIQFHIPGGETEEHISFTVDGTVNSEADFILNSRGDIVRTKIINETFEGIIDVRGATATEVTPTEGVTVVRYLEADIFTLITGTSPDGQIENSANSDLLVNPIARTPNVIGVSTGSLVGDIRNIDTPTTGQVLTATASGLEFADAASGGGDTIFVDDGLAALEFISPDGEDTEYFARNNDSFTERDVYILANEGDAGENWYGVYFRQADVNDTDLQRATVLSISDGTDTGYFRVIRAEQATTDNSNQLVLVDIQTEPFQGTFDLTDFRVLAASDTVVDTTTALSFKAAMSSIPALYSNQFDGGTGITVTDVINANGKNRVRITATGDSAANLTNDNKGDGININSSVISVDAHDGITVNSDGVSVDAANTSITVASAGISVNTSEIATRDYVEELAGWTTTQDEQEEEVIHHDNTTNQFTSKSSNANIEADDFTVTGGVSSDYVITFRTQDLNLLELQANSILDVFISASNEGFYRINQIRIDPDDTTLTHVRVNRTPLEGEDALDELTIANYLNDQATSFYATLGDKTDGEKYAAVVVGGQVGTASTVGSNTYLSYTLNHATYYREFTSTGENIRVLESGADATNADNYTTIASKTY